MGRSSLLLAVAALAIASTAAEARDGCGRGLYFDRGFNSPVHSNLRASEGVKNLLR